MQNYKVSLYEPKVDPGGYDITLVIENVCCEYRAKAEAITRANAEYPNNTGFVVYEVESV